MRIVKKILIVLAVLLLLICAIGLLFFPSKVHVERSIVINKQQDVVFTYVDDLNNYNKWSPWYKLDPAGKYEIVGPTKGVGASMKWESNNSNVGKGQLTYTEVTPNSFIRQDLNFEGALATSYFKFEPEGTNTKTTWAFEMDAGANPLKRIMGKMMDGMLGDVFLQGLTSIKENVEALPEAVPMTEPAPMPADTTTKM